MLHYWIVFDLHSHKCPDISHRVQVIFPVPVLYRYILKQGPTGYQFTCWLNMTVQHTPFCLMSSSRYFHVSCADSRSIMLMLFWHSCHLRWQNSSTSFLCVSPLQRDHKPCMTCIYMLRWRNFHTPWCLSFHEIIYLHTTCMSSWWQICCMMCVRH